MKRIALVIGHGPSRDKGAVSANGKVNELDWNRELAPMIAQAVGNRADCIIVHRTIEKMPPVGAVNALNAVCTAELHLNAYNGTATGTEMIHWPSSKRGFALAQRLLNAAVGVLCLPNRGVKGPQGGGRGAGFLRGTNCPAVIVESFFIDNTSDLLCGTARRSDLAKAYADALVAFCEASP